MILDPTKLRSALARLLQRVPLLHRLLAVNGLVVASGAVTGSYIAVRVARESPELSGILLVAVLAAVGLALSVAINLWMVRWTLAPLDGLASAAGRVQAGEDPAGARVRLPAHADPQLARVVTVFNEMLESVGRHRQRLRRFAHAALETTERERLRQARVLQDDTAQHLAACLLLLGAARTMSDTGRRDRTLADARVHIEASLESVRRLARSLRPPELADVGLESALRAIGREIEERGGPRVLTEADPVSAELDAAVSLVLYRTVREALMNAERHAEASTIRVAVRQAGDRVVARIEDDGRGFDPSEFPADDAPTLGLFAMAERVRSVGGAVDVDSRPGGGTRIRIEVPLGRDVVSRPATAGTL